VRVLGRVYERTCIAGKSERESGVGCSQGWVRWETASFRFIGTLSWHKAQCVHVASFVACDSASHDYYYDYYYFSYI